MEREGRPEKVRGRPVDNKHGRNGFGPRRLCLVSAKAVQTVGQDSSGWNFGRKRQKGRDGMMGVRCAQHSVQGDTASDEKVAIAEWKSGWVEMLAMDGDQMKKSGSRLKMVGKRSEQTEKSALGSGCF